MERKWQVLIVVVAGVFMAGLDVFIVNIAFPQMHTDFPGTSLGSLSWVLNSLHDRVRGVPDRGGALVRHVRAQALLPARHGRCSSTASAACALAPSIPLLVAARAVQGLGAALLMPASLGLLLPEFPAEKRHIAIGIWAAVGGIAAAAGRRSAACWCRSSWRWVFIVNVPVGLASLIAGWRVLREVRHPEPRGPTSSARAC